MVFLVARHLVRSRYGRLLVAVRDREDRVRFLGYDPAVAKTVAFVVAAGMAGAAGAVAAPVIGIVAPNQFAVLPSILMVCWVAVGGRGTLYGAVLGASSSTGAAPGQRAVARRLAVLPGPAVHRRHGVHPRRHRRRPQLLNGRRCSRPCATARAGLGVDRPARRIHVAEAAT